MLDIRVNDNGDVFLAGRFDASQVGKARQVFDTIEKSCIIDFRDLKYISSAGLGELLNVQKRLMDAGEGLRLVNMNPHVSDIFRYAGFHKVFEMEDNRKS